MYICGRNHDKVISFHFEANTDAVLTCNDAICLKYKSFNRLRVYLIYAKLIYHTSTNNDIDHFIDLQITGLLYMINDPSY